MPFHVRDWFVEMQIDAAIAAVVQDPVPRTVTGPRVDTIDPLTHQTSQQSVQFIRRHPEVQVAVGTRLLAQQRVDAPSTADARMDSQIRYLRDELARLVHRHLMLNHRDMMAWPR